MNNILGYELPIVINVAISFIIGVLIYFGVNLERAWKVAKEDIFDLRNKILKVRKDLEKNNY